MQHMNRPFLKKSAFGLLCSVLLFLALILTAACSLADNAEYNLPKDIKNVLKEDRALTGREIAAYAENKSKSTPWAFAVLQSDKGENLIYAFRKSNGKWKFSFRTSNAIPQGKGGIVLRFDVPDELTVALENDSGEYWVKSTIYNLDSSGRWCLSEYMDRSCKMNVSLTSSKITYYGGADLDEMLGSVTGTITTDMRYVSLSLIPGTLKAAKSKYTVAPDIPRGELTAQNIKFTGGKKYEVYSGPGTDYLRAANGKATVSTNDWIQVFGKDGGWILIQYAINKDHMRFGWIPEKALPKSAAVDELRFSWGAATLLTTAAVTDDPLFSQSPLMTLPEGTRVSVLADMGDWVYIEVTTSDSVRGFLKRDQVAQGTLFPLENCPANSGEANMVGTVTVSRNSFSVIISPKVSWNYQWVPVSGFSIYDNISDELLVTVSTVNAAGDYIGSGLLEQSTTSLRIVPLYPDRTASGDEAVVIEW